MSQAEHTGWGPALQLARGPAPLGVLHLTLATMGHTENWKALLSSYNVPPAPSTDKLSIVPDGRVRLHYQGNEGWDGAERQEIGNHLTYLLSIAPPFPSTSPTAAGALYLAQRPEPSFPRGLTAFPAHLCCFFHPKSNTIDPRMSNPSGSPL